EAEEIPQRHALAPGISPGLAHHSVDTDIHHAVERSDGVHDDRVAIVERQRRDNNASEWIYVGARIMVGLTCRGTLALVVRRGHQRDVEGGTRKQSVSPFEDGKDAMDRESVDGRVGAEAPGRA